MRMHVHDLGWTSRRSIVLVSIVVLHGLLFWVAATGLDLRKALQSVAAPIEIVFLKEEIREDKPLPPPPIKAPSVEIPPPVVDIRVPTDTPTAPISSGIAPVAVVRVAPTVDRRNSPTTDDFYPQVSRRRGEAGKVRLRTCVGDDARLQGAPVLEATSGFPMLDEAAVEYAKAVRFTRGIVGGKAVAMCFSWVVTFQ